MYLRDALKDGPVRHIVEGLAPNAHYYKEAIDCLQRQYKWLRLIHQAHVRVIYVVLSLRDSNGHELCRLNDVAGPHLRALKVMNYEPSGPFVTSIWALKLDPTTMFECQRHSQDSIGVTHYTALLEFLDLWTCTSKNSVWDINQRCQTAPPEKTSTILSYLVNIADNCAACKSSKYSLYTCRKLRLLPHKQRWQFSRSTGIPLTALSQDLLSSNVLVAKSAGNLRTLIIPGFTSIKKLLSRLSESHLQTKFLAQWHNIQI